MTLSSILPSGQCRGRADTTLDKGPTQE